ncbi:MAG: hypothetical protein ACQEVA_15035 [Myxococcota bacterium]
MLLSRDFMGEGTAAKFNDQRKAANLSQPDQCDQYTPQNYHEIIVQFTHRLVRWRGDGGAGSDPITSRSGCHIDFTWMADYTSPALSGDNPRRRRNRSTMRNTRPTSRRARQRAAKQRHE